MPSSIFLDFHLPNAATWFYFSVILTFAVFFQFGRLLSLRNLDLLTLFLLVPGFLLLQEAHGLVAGTADQPPDGRRGEGERVFAYAWLVTGSGYWFLRAVFDLALVRRPVLTPNLSPAGLAWLGLALFVCLTAVAVRRNPDVAEPDQVGKRPAPITQLEKGAAAVVGQAQAGAGRAVSPDDIRFWGARVLAMTCHLAVVLALVFVGLRHFGDPTAGLAAGALYLLVPYTAFHIGQYHHVLPAACVTWAVYWYRRPVGSGWLLGVAAGTSVFPVVLLPLWLSFYARRGATRFGLAFVTAAAVSLGLTSLVLWWGGRLDGNWAAELNLTDWQPWRRAAAESLWTGVHGAYRLPVFVLYVGFLAGLTVWPSPKNLSHLIALSAAVLVGVQFWHADRGGVYVLWYLPLVLLMVFRPNLSAHEPPPVEPGGGAVLRWARAGWQRVRPVRTQASAELAV